MVTNLRTSRGQEIARENIRILDQFDKERYPNAYHYLGRLKLDLIRFYEYISDKQILTADHCYCFIIDNVRLTRDVRQKYGSGDQPKTNKRFNLLCALDFLRKYRGKNLRILDQIEGRHKPNVYTIRLYTDAQLKKIEKRAEILRTAGITVTNFSADNLRNARIPEDIVRSALPYNSPNTLSRAEKEEEYKTLTAVIDDQIQKDGYTTRQNLLQWFSNEKELTKIMSEHRGEFRQRYRYNRPTKDHKSLFNLDPDYNSYIITPSAL